MKYITLAIVCISLSGCGLKTGLDMMSSKDSYKQCLIEHTQNIQFCDGYKKAFEADQSTWDSLYPGWKSTNIVHSNQDSH